MVGKRDNKTEEVDLDYFNLLKTNNISLAKALTEERLTNKQCRQEKNALQKKLQAALLLNMRYENILNQLLSQAKHTLPSCIALSETIPHIIKLCNEGINLPKTVDKEIKNDYVSNGSETEKLSHKTHAVKPMVGGHVIFRPTINLRRLNSEYQELIRNIELNRRSATQNEETGNTAINSINVASIPLPIQGRRSSSDYDDEIVDETENVISPPSAVTVENGDFGSLLNGRLESLEPVEEVSEESFEESEQSVNVSSYDFLREARVVISPISLPIEKKQKTKKKTPIVNQDPLEGPSTLLDNEGHFTSPRYHSKPRMASNNVNIFNIHKQLTYSDSSSSSDDENYVTKRTKKRYPLKRKNMQERSRIKSLVNVDENRKPQKKKVKKEAASDNANIPNTVSVSTPTKNIDRKSSIQPIVLLTQLKDTSPNQLVRYSSNNECEESSSAKSTPEINLNDSLRPRRSKLIGSLKEISLKCKLRRYK